MSSGVHGVERISGLNPDTAARTACGGRVDGRSARATHAEGGIDSHAAHHRGLLRFSVNDENMMLKLMLILSSSLVLVLALGSTECCR